jgi:hypothetical protein
MAFTKAQQARFDRVTEISAIITTGDPLRALTTIRESGHLGRTARWQAACKSADGMIADGFALDHAVLQATIWMGHAID